MGDITSQASTTHSGNSSEMVAISAKILVASITIVFILLALLFIVHLYAKWYWLTNSHEDPRVVSWRRRAARARGLDRTALELVPEVEYDPKAFNEGLECAVCLSEVTQGEKVRLLPKCNHGFHVTCIDKWFQSNSTCPLCRNPVVFDQNLSNNNHENGSEFQEFDASSSSESETEDEHNSYASPHANEAPSFPTNVLFWGNDTQVRSLEQPSQEASTSTISSNNIISNGVDRHIDALVIDIPRQVVKDGYDGESESPVVTTLRSLRRLLSGGKRVAPSPRGSSSAGTEQV